MGLAENKLYIYGRKNRKAFDKEHKHFFQDLNKKIKNVFDFRVFFLDPEAPEHVISGAHQDDDFIEQLEDCIENAKKVLIRNNIKIEKICRKYSVYRNIALLVVDEAVIYSPIVSDTLGKVKALTKAPFHIVGSDSEFGAELVEDFLAKWENSKIL